jgi:hypothetical protein
VRTEAVVPDVPDTTPAIATTAHDGVLIAASAPRRADADPWLVSGVILVAGAGVLGGAWWLRRRRSHDGRHY